MPILRISIVTEMEDKDTMEERLAEILELEEDLFLARFHQQVEKAQEKVWHDRCIKQCTFKNGDLVLMYDSMFTKLLGKFQMCCLGPYIIKEIMDGGAVQLVNLNGELFLGRINGSQFKLYGHDPTPAQ